MPDKPFSQACENNKQPILAELKTVFAQSRHVLEIGSGTGQHAAFFAAQLPHLIWQPSDLDENLAGIRLWCTEAGLDKLRTPISMDVRSKRLPDGDFDAVFTANTLHIMHWPQLVDTFALLSALPAAAKLCVYGPFNYDGQFTSDSNARFDAWLRARDPGSGIRDISAVNAEAEKAGFSLQQDFDMPANNRLLYWQKQ